MGEHVWIISVYRLREGLENLKDEGNIFVIKLVVRLKGGTPLFLSLLIQSNSTTSQFGCCVFALINSNGLKGTITYFVLRHHLNYFQYY